MHYGPDFVPHEHRATMDAYERPQWTVETWNAGTLATIAAVRRLAEIAEMRIDDLDESLCSELVATSGGLLSAWRDLQKPWDVAPRGAKGPNWSRFDPDGVVARYCHAFAQIKRACDGAHWLGTVPLTYAAMTPTERLAERLEFGRHWTHPRHRAVEWREDVRWGGAEFIKTAESHLLGPHAKFWSGFGQ